MHTIIPIQEILCLCLIDNPLASILLYSNYMHTQNITKPIQLLAINQPESQPYNALELSVRHNLGEGREVRGEIS